MIVEDLQRIVDKRTKAEKVLVLLIESGVLYIVSTVRLISSLNQKKKLIFVDRVDLGCVIPYTPAWIPLRTRGFILAGGCSPGSK